MKCHLLSLLLLLCSLPALHGQAPRPNIIFFFVDDLGYGDLGCFWQDQRSGSKKFDTPGIDAMAAAGAKLTHHYVSASVCAPSRASLMQGRHQGHCDVRNSQFDKALPDNHTIASVLRGAGYRTIHIGKGGLSGAEGSVALAGDGSRNLAAHPLDRGFDRFFGYLFHGDGHEHYPANGTTDKSAHIYDDFRQVTDASLDLYTTDAWTAAAKKEIIDEATDGDDQPFFLYLAYDTPHFKMQRPAVAYPALDNDGDPLTGGIQWTTSTDAFGRVRYASTADGTGTIDAYTHPDIPGGWSNSEKQHVGMIRRIDSSISDILRTLEELDLAGNTLCVFSSDNGPHNEGNNPRTFQSYANMEGIKRDMWEAGIRVPTIVHWPGQLAGATNDPANIHEIIRPSAIWDWMPTFCELAGVPAPAWCDGVSLAPDFTGTGLVREKGYLYFEFQSSGSTPDWSQFPNHRNDPKGQMQCLRIGDHMGIRTNISNGSEPFRIYEVTSDPGQGTDLASSLPDLQTRMQRLALTARRPGGGVSRPYDSLPLPAESPSQTTPGLSWSAYQDAGASWQWIPEFRDLPPDLTGQASALDLSHRPSDNHFGLLFHGFIDIPQTGNYTFHLKSDTGADFFLHDAHLIDEDFNHTGDKSSPSVNLEAGRHPFRLYYRHTTGPRLLSLEWSGPGFTRQPIPATAFSIETPPGLVATPDFAITRINEAVLIDVLANDSDDGLPTPISITSVGPPDFGSAEVSENGILFTPPVDFLGTARFAYTITDGEESRSAEVSITVVIPQPPMARDDTAATIGNLSAPGTPVTILPLLNDEDPDQGPAPLAVTGAFSRSGSTLALAGNEITYTPKAGFFGLDEVRYTLSDGSAEDTATIRVEVTVPGPDRWYPLDEISGFTALDAGGGKVATLLGFDNNPAQWIDGRWGGALRFDGNDDHLSLTGYQGISGTNPRTVAAWIKTSGTGGQPVIAWGPNSAGQKWTFLVQNGNIRLEVTQGFRQGTTIVNDGEWHHVACTWENDGTPNADDLKLYVDGVLETSFNAERAQAINTSPTIDVRIGRDVQERPFEGEIDDVRIIARALTALEVSELASRNESTIHAGQWFYRSFGRQPSGISEWNEDRDGDGLSVFGEYALGGSPHFPNPSIQPRLENTNGSLAFIFNRRREGILPASYHPESSSDPGTGDWTAMGAATVEPHPDLPGFDRVRVSVPTDQPRFFIRLRISGNSP